MENLVEKKDDMMKSNIAKSFVAKISYMKGLMDEGYEIDVPKKFKWRKEKTRDDPNFIKKLKSDNIGILH